MKTIPTPLIAPLFNPATFGVRGAIDDIMMEVRREYPLAVAEVPGFDPYWIVSRHADVAEISRQNELFHNADRSATLISKAGEELVQEFTGGGYNLFRSLVQLDGDEHAKHRMVAVKPLSPQGIAKLQAQVQRAAAEQVQRIREIGPEFDWAKEIAMPYPLNVVLDFVGVPRVDHPKILRLTQWLFSWADPDLKRPGTEPTDPTHQVRTWKIVYDEFGEYATALFNDRRAHPQDDLASVVANARINGEPMDLGAEVSYFGILATAGHDTTAHTTSTAMWMLAENPALLARLQADLSLIPAFVEEAIRWATPVKQFIRHATADCIIADTAIARGDRLYLAYPSANRDAAAFDDPFTFRLDRKANRHLGFGGGTHVCLGQHLARLEMRTLWETLIPCIESVDMNGQGRLIESEFVSGPKSVPIRLRIR
jgi:cytochrome P450